MNSMIYFIGLDTEITELMMYEINCMYKAFKDRYSNLEILKEVVPSYLCSVRECVLVENTFIVTGIK